jgi:hypothetical protein
MLNNPPGGNVEEQGGLGRRLACLATFAHIPMRGTPSAFQAPQPRRRRLRLQEQRWPQAAQKPPPRQPHLREAQGGNGSELMNQVQSLGTLSFLGHMAQILSSRLIRLSV